MTEKIIESRLTYCLDAFSRLATELNLSERQLFSEAGMDQSIVSQQRNRIKNNKTVSGFSVLAFIKLVERFPNINVNAFFKDDEPFFGTKETPSKVLLDDARKTSSWQIRYFEKSKMVEALEQRVKEQSTMIAMLQEMLNKKI